MPTFEPEDWTLFLREGDLHCCSPEYKFTQCYSLSAILCSQWPHGHQNCSDLKIRCFPIGKLDGKHCSTTIHNCIKGADCLFGGRENVRQANLFENLHVLPAKLIKIKIFYEPSSEKSFFKLNQTQIGTSMKVRFWKDRCNPNSFEFSSPQKFKRICRSAQRRSLLFERRKSRKFCGSNRLWVSEMKRKSEKQLAFC